MITLDQTRSDAIQAAKDRLLDLTQQACAERDLAAFRYTLAKCWHAYHEAYKLSLAIEEEARAEALKHVNGEAA